MSRILIQNLSFSYKTHYHSVFNNVTLNLDTDWKLGVIGRNGRGKTTFLKLISGELLPDSGKIIKEVNTEFFPYEYEGIYKNTLDIIKECAGSLRSLEEQLDCPQILQEYIDLDGFSMEGKITREVKRMGLREEILERDFETLSGGEKTKVLLIALFVKQNTFVLLDEPTNHLDIRGKNEVANYLKKKKGFMVVSHDREFIDQVVDHILSINKKNIKIEKGNYTTWKNNKDIIEEYELRTKKNIVKEIKKLEGHAAKKRDWASVSNTQKYHFASNSRTNGVQAYLRQAKRAELLVEKNIQEKKNLLLNYEEAKQLEFHQAKIEDEWLIKIENLSYSYVPNNKVLDNISLKVKSGDAIWIKGPNGSGKSTLLKLISKELFTSQIKYNENVTFSFLNQELYFEDDLTGNDFLKAGIDLDEEYGECLELCNMFDVSVEDLIKPCSLFSSGEKKKLVEAKILSQRNHIIILDEPLNYMDVMFREQLENAILQIRPTIIFVEHDIRFGQNIATDVLELNTTGERI